MTWVGTDRDRELGYEVRESFHGMRLGWVQRLSWRRWQGFCIFVGCDVVGEARTRPAAALVVQGHWATRHR